MRFFANIAAGLRALTRCTRVEREMDEELLSFLESSARDKQRAGMTAEEAARAARIEMGSANAVKHRICSAGWETAAENLGQDIRYTVRMQVKSPAFTLVAALLVCIGIYGLLSYAVARRTSEIGVRMALGAGRAGVRWLILREILVLVAIGVALGVPVALGGNQLAVKLLYGVTPADPLSPLAAVAVMVSIAIIAGYLPARRASLVEPTVALRCE